MATSKYYLLLRDEDLYFVLGTVTTTRWLIGSYVRESNVARGGHLHSILPNLMSNRRRDVTCAHYEAPTVHHGPICATSPMSNNQCLFAHYAKLKRRPARPAVKRLWHKIRLRLRGVARSIFVPQPKGHSQPSGRQYVVQSGQLVKEVSHPTVFVNELALDAHCLLQPVNILLEYILEVRHPKPCPERVR